METSRLPIEVIRGGFGKLPCQPDFVRVEANGREILALDQWLQEGIYYSRQELGPAWETGYDMALFHRFEFRADNAGQTVLGVIRAAMDAYERRFPFIAFGMLPTRLIDYHPMLLPVVSEPLYQELERTIEDVSAMNSLPTIKQRLERGSVLPIPVGTFQDRFDTFLDEVQCGELAKDPIEAVMLIEDLAQTLRGTYQHPRRLTVALEVPLNQPLYARALELRFWRELCIMLLDWYPPTFSMFWPSTNAASGPTSLFMTFRQPSSSLLTSLLQPGRLSRNVWQPGQHLSFAGASSKLSGILRISAGDPLRSLFEQLCPGYPSSCRWPMD